MRAGPVLEEVHRWVAPVCGFLSLTLASRRNPRRDDLVHAAQRLRAAADSLDQLSGVSTK